MNKRGRFLPVTIVLIIILTLRPSGLLGERVADRA